MTPKKRGRQVRVLLETYGVRLDSDGRCYTVSRRRLRQHKKTRKVYWRYEPVERPHWSLLPNALRRFAEALGSQGLGSLAQEIEAAADLAPDAKFGTATAEEVRNLL